MISTLDINPAVADFATAVRRELLGFDAEAVSELTDGLEADLADKLLDGAELGDPAAYAAELRAAAGLEVPRRTTAGQKIRAEFAQARADLAPLFAHPVVTEVAAFFASLRPVWWLLRGLALFSIFNDVSPMPRNPAALVLLMGMLVLSVQWGRGRWLPWRWSHGAVVVLSVLALMVLPFLTTNTIHRLTFQDTFNAEDYLPTGLVFDGQQISNIFAYGADGEPLEDVRLFDQNGEPLSTIDEDFGQDFVEQWTESGESSVLVPSDRVGGSPGWNVYPYEVVDHDVLTENNWTVPSSAKRSPATPPFASVQQLLGYEAPVEAPAEDEVEAPPAE
jgi:hypothetical protein